jgi:hypothetical protein
MGILTKPIFIVALSPVHIVRFSTFAQATILGLALSDEIVSRYEEPA